MGKKDLQIMVPLNYLSNFWRTLALSLIYCEINILLTWSLEFILVTGTAIDQKLKFTITDAKCYVAVETSSAQYTEKLLQQLKASFKRIINWNKYQTK